MLVEIISGYPFKKCGCWSEESKTGRTYHWVNFGVILVESITNYISKSCKHILIQVIEHWEEKEKQKTFANRKVHIILMSIRHIFEEASCPHCEIGLIGKVVTYDLRNRENYLDGIVIITIYICLRCQVTIYEEIRDFSL